MAGSWIEGFDASIRAFTQFDALVIKTRRVASHQSIAELLDPTVNPMDYEAELKHVSPTTAPTAVVTGSSSGIGLATAKLLASRGYKVVVHGGHNLQQMQDACDEIATVSSDESPVMAVTADVSNGHSCRRLIDACFRQLNNIDLWVNNAGADLLTGTATKLSFDQKLQRLLAVDVQGTICLSRLFAQRVRANPPSQRCPLLINIGWDQSSLGMEGDPGQLFGTAKAAVTAFSQSLALTASPSMRVNVVAPGWIQTSWGKAAASEFWSTRAVTESMLQRWGQPEDVAEAIAWLASPAAAFINGQVININGGRRFYPHSK